GWTIPKSALTQPTHRAVPTRRSSDRNQGAASAAYTVTVDTTAPAAPAITAATDNVAPVTGTVSSGGSTNDTTVTFSGTAESGSTITRDDTDSTTMRGTGTATGGA